ncbi:MAG TPA: PilZ domain-containing protein [Xanthobacteraceae bacterium]|jgi:hypothetical protein|nr:PilZ domain-containing protein [Xanthobacteraceae bacterium]
MSLPGSEKRRFVRTRPSGLVSRTAKIIVPQSAPIDCTVVDLSAGGACLDLADAGRLPARFTLLHGATKKSCLVMWKKFRRVGVQF